MKLEIEKKYELTDHDYEIIKNSCVFIDNQEIKDYYLDMADLRLAKANYKLRLRNGLYELKIMTKSTETGLVSSQEIEDDDIINTHLQKFSCTIDDVTGILFVETKREKYNYIYNGYTITLDIDIYQYGKRYEIEILQEVGDNITSSERQDLELELNSIINKCREKLGLEATNSIITKTTNCALHQNIELYEVMSGDRI